jgi:DNA polymerase sigma
MFVGDDYRGDDVSTLAQTRRLLKIKCGNFLDSDIELIPAKVPILKMYDKIGGLHIDLSCGNETAIRNSNLLFCYSQVRIYCYCLHYVLYD